MKYTVSWTPAAEGDLASVWMEASDPKAMTAAANSVEKRLAQDPDAQGQPLYDTVRSLVIPPLGVEFEVIVADRIVYVLTAWDTSKATPP